MDVAQPCPLGLLRGRWAGLTGLRRGYGGPPKLYAKAEGLRYERPPLNFATPKAYC
jgi:hypothetical protein